MSASQNIRSTWLVCLGLALVTLALFWPVRHYDFVQYDDDAYVFNNPTVRSGLSWWGLVWSVVDAHASNWHPLTWLSHMLDCQLFGLNAGAHHLVNVFFHCANAVLLFLLLRTMTGALWRSAFVAALFAWHPLHVESVAWISERKDVLSGFFFMLTLWTYVLYAQIPVATSAEKGDAPTRAHHLSRSAYYRWSLVFFVLGLLSKPMVVTVPLVLLLIDFWPLKRFRIFARSDSDTHNGVFGSGLPRELLIEKVPFFISAFILSVITLWAQNYGHSLVSFKSVGMIARVEYTLIDYLGYLEKLFWPHNLSILNLRPPAEPLWLVLVAVLVLLGISILAVVNLRSRRYLLMGWLWFLIMLVPVIGLIPVGLQSVADRYSYLPSIGLFIMVAWSVEEIAATIISERTRGIGLAAVAVAVLVTCTALTRHQLGYWKNTRTLMEHALKIDPNNYIAHDDLGVYFSKKGRIKEALYHYQRYRELSPDFKRQAESMYGTNQTNEAPTNTIRKP